MIYNQKEVLRFMGAAAQDPQAAQLCDVVYLKLRNEVQPRSLIRRTACQTNANEVRVDGAVFHSQALAGYLQGCEEVLLFAATLGPKVDSAIKRLTLLSLTEGNAAQAVAASLIENYSNQVLAEYDTGDLHQLPRFSPGYADWQLSEQKEFFQLLNCQSIGLTLTDSCMMTPVKSITAIVGLSKSEGHPASSCEICGLENCVYRRGGMQKKS